MKVIEASAVIPLSPEETWSVRFGDQVQRSVEAAENIISRRLSDASRRNPPVPDGAKSRSLYHERHI